MSELERRIAALSPERRALFERRVREAGLAREGESGIRRLPPAEHYALSFGQQRLWFIDQLAPGSPAYNIPFAGRFEGPLDPALIERCVGEIVRRHEVLRSTFHSEDGGPVQRVQPAGAVPVPLDDLTALPAAERESEAERRVDGEARAPFDLARGPLVRVRLLRLAAEEHVLCVTMPHIVTDAWSMAVFFREFPALYEAYAAGEPSPLPELPIQFRDYAAWQRERLAGAERERLLAFWRNYLEGAPGVLEIPADHRRPPAQTFRGERHAVDLPRAATQALEALAQREGATPFMALLAVFDLLLQHWTGQDDLLVGSPVATRAPEASHGLIGFFINTLVFRTDLSGNPTFRELLGRVRESCLAAYANQDLPFEQLVEAIGVERDLARPPLAQAGLVLQNVHIPTPDFQRLRLTHFQQTCTRTAKFDLMLGLWEGASGPEGWFEYSTDLFDRPTIERMTLQLRRLVEQVVRDPDRRVGAIEWLGREERQLVIEQWNATRRDAPLERGIADLFTEQARLRPGAVAVVAGEACVSYGELDRRADRLAHQLRALGVRAETPVGLALERSADVPVALLGVLKAGGAYAPVDPGDPRGPELLRALGARVVIVEPDDRQRFEASGARAVTLDPPAPEPGSPAAAWGLGGEHLACVLHTSGSTGRPKGVEVPHRAIVRLVRGADYAAFGEDEVVLHLAPLAFDASSLEIWGPLLNGGRLVIHPPGPPTPAGLRAIVSAERVTTLWLSAGLFHVVVDEDLEALRPLRHLLAGGDVLSPAHVRMVQERLPHLTLTNGYGPTEGATFTACHPVAASDTLEPSVPIGRPIANTRVYVLDRHGRPCPPGVPGELHLAGAGLARGYAREPALTARRFVPDPFGEAPGGRMYRTGDRARWRSDGRLEFMGRLDAQLKIRGHRVEPAEVENALTALPGVAAAAVAGHGAEAHTRRLVAHVMLRDGARETAASLREALRARLPEPLVPSSFVLVERMPLTAAGKLDRGALPPPEAPPVEAAAPPRTATEAALAAAWSQILGRDVGREDHFFELGGDSIQAIQVVARARAAGLEITPAEVFEHPVLADLARRVADRPAARPAAEPVERDGEVPLTPIQRWFFARVTTDPHHWNLPLTLAVRAPLDPGVVERALGELAVRHDALRLSFARDANGAWRQRLAAPRDARAPRLERFDLAGLSPQDTAREVERIAATLQAGLDLAREPLMRAAWFTRGGRPPLLLLVFHHLIMDAVSARIVIEDLERACLAAPGGEPPVLAPRSAPFSSWARALEAAAAAGVFEPERERWSAALSAAPAPLPRDLDSAADEESGRNAVTLRLDADATRRLLHDAPAAWRAAAEDLVLAAFARALARWSGSPRVRIDLESHGRETGRVDGLDLSRTVGWFTSLAPLGLDLPAAGERQGAALAAVKEARRALLDRGLGYGVLRHLAPGASGAPLGDGREAEASFNYLGVLDGPVRDGAAFALERFDCGPWRSPRAPLTHQVMLDALVMGGRLELVLAGGASHRRETLERLAGDLAAELTALGAAGKDAAADAIAPSDFPEAGMDAEELERLLGRVLETGPGDRT